MNAPHAITEQTAALILSLSERATRGPWEPTGLKPTAQQMLIPSVHGYSAVRGPDHEEGQSHTMVCMTGQLGGPVMTGQLGGPGEMNQSMLDAAYLAHLSPPIVHSLLTTLSLARAAMRSVMLVERGQGALIVVKHPALSNLYDHLHGLVPRHLL